MLLLFVRRPAQRHGNLSVHRENHFYSLGRNRWNCKISPQSARRSYEERVSARNSGHAKRRLTENNAIRWYRTRDCKTTTNREREKEREREEAREEITSIRRASHEAEEREVRSIIENNGTGRSIFVSIFPLSLSLSLFPRIEKYTKMLPRRAYLPPRHEINGVENSSKGITQSTRLLAVVYSHSSIHCFVVGRF